MPPPPPPISNECKELVTCETFGPEYDEEDSSTVSTTKESIRGIEDNKAPKRPASSYGKWVRVAFTLYSQIKCVDDLVYDRTRIDRTEPKPNGKISPKPNRNRTEQFSK